MMGRSLLSAAMALGGMLPAGGAEAAFTDAKFGQYQVADTQWNVNACTTTTTCQITSKNPGTAYGIPFDRSNPVNWGTNGDRYIGFVPNMTGSPAVQDATNPWLMNLYEADGTVARVLGTGHTVSAGTDANGDLYFFFVGNDNNTGQLFSGSLGMSGTGGLSFTGTLNPSVSKMNSLSTNMSTAPLGENQVISGGSEPGDLSILERVLNVASTGPIVQLNGVFANIAEAVGSTDPDTGEALTAIDGRIVNIMAGMEAATASVGAQVAALDQVRVDVGDLSTTVLGAVNTGEITLGTNQSVDEALTRSSSAVSSHVMQLGGSAETGAMVLNIASNTMDILGSVHNTFDQLNGSVGNVTTTVLGAVNTGTITSGVGETVHGIRSNITGG